MGNACKKTQCKLSSKGSLSEQHQNKPRAVKVNLKMKLQISHMASSIFGQYRQTSYPASWLSVCLTE